MRTFFALTRCVLLLSLSAVPLFGQDSQAHWLMVPSLVSGTLSPFLLAVDGQPLRREREEATAIYLNDTLIHSNSDTHRSFFVKTDSDVLRFRVRLRSGTMRELPFLVLPR